MVEFTKEEIAAAKKRGPERHLSKKYNFAGPGTEYAARMKGSDYYEGLMKAAGRPVVGTKPYNKPFDKVDSCGLPHDKVFNDPNASTAEIRRADDVFQQCTLKAAQDTDIPDERLRGIFAAGGFELKRRLEDAALLRKGSFAQAGESTASQLVRLGKKTAGTAIGNKVSSLLSKITKGTKNK
tara:strand:- start:642 stop:1187 length:546 start_codon:yes stop_codon:yes gene_type:complete